MAKVTLIFIDITDPNGEAGLSVEAVFDPELTEDGKDLTIAQAWGKEVIDQIMDNATEVEMMGEGRGTRNAGELQ